MFAKCKINITLKYALSKNKPNQRLACKITLYFQIGIIVQGTSTGGSEPRNVWFTVQELLQFTLPNFATAQLKGKKCRYNHTLSMLNICTKQRVMQCLQLACVFQYTSHAIFSNEKQATCIPSKHIS